MSSKRLDTIADYTRHANHQVAKTAIKRFYMPVDGGLHSKGNISALIGESRTGKTYAANEIFAAHQPVAGKDGLKRSVLLVDSPIEGGARSILESIATSLGMNPSLRISSINSLS